MQPDMTSKTITLRLPHELYATAVDLAQRRKTSLNRLIQEGLELLRKVEEDARLYDSFTVIGGDGESSDVGFATPAQSEIVLNERA